MFHVFSALKKQGKTVILGSIAVLRFWRNISLCLQAFS